MNQSVGGRPHSFTIVSVDRVLHCLADSEEDMSAWISGKTWSTKRQCDVLARSAAFQCYAICCVCTVVFIGLLQHCSLMVRVKKQVLEEQQLRKVTLLACVCHLLHLLEVSVKDG